MSSPRDYPLEQALRDLPRIGTLVKDRGYRQIWRFEHAQAAYYLKFYPHRPALRLRRLLRGSPALREFRHLLALQQAAIPCPRAVAVLMGLHVRDQAGDAVVLQAIEPSVQLDQYLNDLQLQGIAVPDHLDLARQIRALLAQMEQARLGHNDLHMGNFLLCQKKLYLLDGYAVHSGGLTREDVLLLADSASRYATRTDLQRGWEMLASGGSPPPRNPVALAHWRKSLRRVFGPSRYFGRLRQQRWRGVFFRQFKYAQRWSMASRLLVSDQDWQQGLGPLLAQIEADQLQIIKRSRSGDVLAGQVVLGGQPVPIIVKRPRRRYWYRYINEIGRGGRARRAWRKAWSLIYRNIPTAWPILLLEKRVLGYVTDSVIVFERIAGKTLAEVNLDEIQPPDRDMLFRRTGRLLRQLEQRGLYHWDAKASNWIVRNDPQCGPAPVLVDVDGIRAHWGVAEGMRRLLLSMRQHPQYTPADSLALCQGYAPFARVQQES